MSIETPTERRIKTPFELATIEDLLTPEVRNPDGELLLDELGNIKRYAPGKRVQAGIYFCEPKEPKDEGYARLFYQLVREFDQEPEIKQKLELSVGTPRFELGRRVRVRNKENNSDIVLGLKVFPGTLTGYAYQARIEPGWIVQPCFRIDKATRTQVEKMRKFAYLQLNLARYYQQNSKCVFRSP